MKKDLELYPGSPGHVTDFRPLIKRLEESGLTKFAFGLAYSFGTRQALLELERQEQQKNLILISPYLFPSSSPSKLKKVILKTPYIGNRILEKLGPKSIEQFLIDSSYPCSVTKEYREQSKKYLSPELLKNSILEKDVSNKKLQDALKAISDSQKVKICLIRGDQDKTSNYDQQIRPLVDNLEVREFIIKKAGHALIWTHQEEVAHSIKQFLEEL